MSTVGTPTTIDHLGYNTLDPNWLQTVVDRISAQKEAETPEIEQVKLAATTAIENLVKGIGEAIQHRKEVSRLADNGRLYWHGNTIGKKKIGTLLRGAQVPGGELIWHLATGVWTPNATSFSGLATINAYGAAELSLGTMKTNRSIPAQLNRGITLSDRGARSQLSAINQGFLDFRLAE